MIFVQWCALENFIIDRWRKGVETCSFKWISCTDTEQIQTSRSLFRTLKYTVRGYMEVWKHLFSKHQIFRALSFQILSFFNYFRWKFHIFLNLKLSRKSISLEKKRSWREQIERFVLSYYDFSFFIF